MNKTSEKINKLDSFELACLLILCHMVLTFLVLLAALVFATH